MGLSALNGYPGEVLPWRGGRRPPGTRNIVAAKPSTASSAGWGELFGYDVQCGSPPGRWHHGCEWRRRRYEMLNDAAQAGGPAIPRLSNDAPRRLSFPQERLFLLDRIMPGLPVYNVPTLVRVAGTLDEELLRQALERVVERHELLRSAIKLV